MACFVFSPLTWALLAVAAWPTWRWLGRPLRIAAMVLAALVVMMCMSLGANVLVRYAEWLVPRPALCGQATGDRRIETDVGGFRIEPGGQRPLFALGS